MISEEDWNMVKSKIWKQEEIDEIPYKTWIEPLRLGVVLSVGEKIYVALKYKDSTGISQIFIERRYTSMIEKYFSEFTGKNVRIKIVSTD